MLDKPQILDSVEQLTAVIHITIPRAEISNVMSPAIAEVMTAIATQKVAIIGPCFSFHTRIPTDTFDFDVGFPINCPIEPIGRVYMKTLPATKVVRTIYRGAYEGLGAAWGEFCAWIENEGLNTQACLWESYLSGPESSPNPDHWQTELIRPLAL